MGFLPRGQVIDINFAKKEGAPRVARSPPRCRRPTAQVGRYRRRRPRWRRSRLGGGGAAQGPPNGSVEACAAVGGVAQGVGGTLPGVGGTPQSSEPPRVSAERFITRWWVISGRIGGRYRPNFSGLGARCAWKDYGTSQEWVIWACVGRRPGLGQMSACDGGPGSARALDDGMHALRSRLCVLFRFVPQAHACLHRPTPCFRATSLADFGRRFPTPLLKFLN